MKIRQVEAEKNAFEVLDAYSQETTYISLKTLLYMILNSLCYYFLGKLLLLEGIFETLLCVFFSVCVFFPRSLLQIGKFSGSKQIIYFNRPNEDSRQLTLAYSKASAYRNSRYGLE